MLGAEYRVEGLGLQDFGVCSLGSRVEGFWVESLGFRV